MGLAFETIAGRVVNPGAVATALTANTGDAFAVRAFDSGTNTYLHNAWAHEATPGILRIRSARLHDFVQGLRFQVGVASARGLIPAAVDQPLYYTDILTVEMTGGAAETDVGVLQLYYQSVGGLAARLANWSQVAPRIVNILTVEVDITAAATLGDWSAGTPLNTTFDLLKADYDYAILGYECSASVAAIALRGPDTGNVKVGGPGTTESIETRDYWIKQGNDSGLAMIPIIAANNKGSTLAFQCSASAGVTNNVGFIVAQLSPTA
jgi:hypothetical protein